MSKVLKAAWKGICIAAVMFVISCMINGFNGGEEKFTTGVHMGYMCLAAIVIGIGFGVPSLIYETELPIGLKILIHMGTGILVMLVTSICVGWIDLARGWKICLLIAAIQIAIAFGIWALSCIRTRRDAKQMNERIEAKKQ